MCWAFGPCMVLRECGAVSPQAYSATALGGLGGVSLGAQLIGTLTGVVFALALGLAIYGALKATVGIRLSPEEEAQGADLSIHKIRANPEADVMGL